jgi:hypothetical protein
MVFLPSLPLLLEETITIWGGSGNNANRQGQNRETPFASIDNISQIMTRRQTGAYHVASRHRTASRMNISNVSQTSKILRKVELDSHADTCGVNNVTRILEYTNQVAEVTCFANSLSPLQDILIVKTALAYDHPDTGEVIVLIINQALYFGDQLDKILLNPNQLRAHGIQVDDVPRQFGGTSHSITALDVDLIIPLKMKGIISYFPVRTPSPDEIENCTNVILTSDSEWDLYSSAFQEIEETDNQLTRTIKTLYKEYTDIMDDLTTKLLQIKEVTTMNRKNLQSAEQLANTWAIPITMANNTLKATTQEFIRSALHPIERRFRTKNVMLKYNRLNCKVYSDTFFSNHISLSGNKCAQLFVTNFGYLKFSLMKNKSEAGYALQEMNKEVGIPTRLNTDRAKELTAGKWKEICRDANITMTQTERDSPWQNRTEVEICELKHHVQRLMGRTQSPIQLWDICSSYAVDLRNRLARSLPQLQGRTC